MVRVVAHRSFGSVPTQCRTVLPSVAWADGGDGTKGERSLTPQRDRAVSQGVESPR
jgi:hypothetical protein